LDAVALLKLPRGGDYWNDKRMKFMINGTESHIHDFDGCVHDLTTQFAEGTLPLKKPWRIVSWGVRSDFNKKCARSHDHGECASREAK
jgi:hypothetical protein